MAVLRTDKHRYFPEGTAYKIFPAYRYEGESFEPDGVVHAVPARTVDGQWVPHHAPGEKTECGKDAGWRQYELLPKETPITCPDCLKAMGQ